MTNSVAEYWDVDGTSLHTYASAIETTNEGIRGVPPLRGGDVQVPFRPGEVWKKKVAGPRVISLRMWVRGTFADGSEPTDPAVKHALFNDNFKALQLLLWRTDRQLQLTKRWYTLVGGVLTLMSATASAEFVGGLDNMSVIDQNRDAQAGKFTVDLKLADPYFYGDWTTVGPGGVVAILGDDITRQIKVTFSGAGSLENSTTGRILSVGGACTVDVWNFGAPGQLDTLTTTGQTDEQFWFTLRRGNNTLVASGVSQVQYRPVYL